MRFSVGFLIVVGLAICAGNGVFALDSRSLEDIRQSGELRVLLVEDDWWPFFHEDDSGKLAGIDIDLAKSIAQALDVSPVFVRQGTFNELAGNLNRGMADVILSYYSYSPVRNLDVLLSRPYLTDSDGVLLGHAVREQAKRQSSELSPEQAIQWLNQEQLRVGTFSGTSYETWAQQTFPNARLVLVEPENFLDVLEAGEVDAFYFAHHWLQFTLASHPQLSLRFAYQKLLRQDFICIGIPQGQVSTLLWIDRFLGVSLDVEALVEERYQALLEQFPPLLSDQSQSTPFLSEPWRSLLLAAMVALCAWFLRRRQQLLRKRLRDRKAPHWLLNTWTVVFSMVLGVYVGAVYPGLVPFLSPIGDLFFHYLLLTGVPILFLMVVLNFVRLMSSMGGLRFFGKFMAILLVCLLVGSAIGLLVGLVGKPGEGISQQDQQRVAQALQDQEQTLQTAVDMSPAALLWMLPQKMIPDSIVRAFAENRTLPILVFGIFFAFALRIQKEESRRRLCAGMEQLQNLFIDLFKVSYYLLPIGLFSLMLGQAQTLTRSAGVFSAFLKFTLSQLVVVLLWTIISWAFGSWISRLSPMRYLALIKKPLVIMFSLLSALAAFPAAMEACEQNEKYRDPNVKGSIPLLMMFLTPSIASMFSLTVVFLTQLVGIPLGVGPLLFLLFGTVGATLATIGMPVPAFLFAMSVLVAPFGIPVSQAVFFLLPWCLTGMRLETVSYLLLDFGVARLFAQKTPKKAAKPSAP